MLRVNSQRPDLKNAAVSSLLLLFRRCKFVGSGVNKTQNHLCTKQLVIYSIGTI